MFSSIDRPGWRTVSCEAVDSRGHACTIRLVLPRDLTDMRMTRTELNRLLVQPSPRRLLRLAEALLALDFLPIGQETGLYGKFLDNAQRSRRQDSSALTDQGSRSGERRAVYRLRLPRERRSNQAITTRMKSVRLRVWRLHFDPVQHRLRCDLLLAPVTAELP